MTATDPTDPGARAAELRAQLDDANHRYHVLDAPTISDRAYDLLFRELVDLEAANPELVTEDSPTQRVGAPVEGGFPSVRHEVPMLSLGNAFGADELREFDARVRQGPGTRAGRPAGRVRLRAQDRWPGDQPALRRPPVRSRRHAR